MADDLLLVDAADGGVAGVNGDFAVVAHDEDLAVGHLEGKLDVGLAVGLRFSQVGLVDHFLVDVDVALLVDVDPFPAARNDTLDEDIVVVVKGHDLAGVHPAALDGEDDVAVVQGAVHGLAVDVQDGQEEDGNQDGDRGDRNEPENRVAHSPQEAPAVPLLFQFPLQEFTGGELVRGDRGRRLLRGLR